jgi:hypothetical protein
VPGQLPQDPYGYNYVATSLVSTDLTEKWNLGVSVPYLYKYMRDPYQIGIDVSNQGLGDVNLLLTPQAGAHQRHQPHRLGGRAHGDA